VNTDDAKRYKIICYLATGCSNKEAAEQAGVSLSTIERLKRDADFKTELYEAVHQIYRNGLLKLTLGIDKAASELLRIIESGDTPDRVKLKAIEILLAQTSNLDSLSLEERLNRLQEQIDRQEQIRFLHPVQFVQSSSKDEETDDD
jgi:transposase